MYLVEQLLSKGISETVLLAMSWEVT